MESVNAAKKPHVVFIPAPFQSHISSMLKFAKLVYLQGFYITFVNTEFNHRKLLKSNSLKILPDFQFESIPDGLVPPTDDDDAQDPLALLEFIKTNLLAPFLSLIININQASVSSASSPPRVTCIVSDFCMASPLQAAQQLGIPGFLYCPLSAIALMGALHCQQLVEKGLIPLKDKSDLDMPIDFIPGLSNIRLKDLPSHLWEDDDPMNNFFTGQLKRIHDASAIIINTFDALETEVLEAIKSLLPPVYAVGPLQLPLNQLSDNQLNSIGANLWKENEECITWLDSKQPNSVLYVSFGSLASLSPQQLAEFAWGISNSKQSFLWIIRSDLVIGEAAIFPPEFIEATADKGMISGWCPQEQVLCHPSIGGFLTHSGWNSTMETICGGVPILSRPFGADQQMNCRYSCVHWGIGMEIDREVRRDEVEGLVRELMEGDKGKEMKKKSLEWKKRAEAAVKPGGTSYEDFDKIAKVLLQKSLG